MKANNPPEDSRTPAHLPLTGVRVLEFEGIGPGPMAGRMLMGMGAEVTLIGRPQPAAVAVAVGGASVSSLRQGKRVQPIDLKQQDGIAHALDLISGADVLIEGNRPGVMERLGLGPTDCARINPRLIYGRITGWGQSGPLSHAAGHDLNYVALTGLLALSNRDGSAPILPPTVVGDATGALGLCYGIVCALLDMRSTGRGRVVDAAIVDIVAMLGMLAQMLHADGQLGGIQPSPFHDSPFYDTYRCADGHFISLGALEPQFYTLLLHKLGFDDVDPARQFERQDWPGLKARMTQLFLSRTRATWDSLLAGTDACFAPVLTLDEARSHPHNMARGIFEGTTAASAPRFQFLAES